MKYLKCHEHLICKAAIVPVIMIYIDLWQCRTAEILSLTIYMTQSALTRTRNIGRVTEFAA